MYYIQNWSRLKLENFRMKKKIIENGGTENFSWSFDWGWRTSGLRFTVHHLRLKMEIQLMFNSMVTNEVNIHIYTFGYFLSNQFHKMKYLSPLHCSVQLLDSFNVSLGFSCFENDQGLRLEFSHQDFLTFRRLNKY